MFEYKREYSEGLKYPKGCCKDINGNIYIVDNNNHRIIKLNSNLEYMSQFGVTGTPKTDNTGLNYPAGCCADSNGNIYIADTVNHRLVKLNNNLEYVGQFGVTGVSKKDNTGLNGTKGCCVDFIGNIYVSDTDNHRIIKLNSDLQYMSQFGVTGTPKTDNTGLNEPIGCNSDSNNNIYVVERTNQRLVKLNSNLEYMSQFGVTGTPKTDNTGLNYPQYCCTDDYNNIYITDTRNNRIIKLNSNLEYMSQFGITNTVGTSNFGMNAPHGCYTDSDHNVYISDASNNRFIIIKELYAYEKQFGTTGTAKPDNTGLSDPRGCCSDLDHNIYVVDTSNHRLVKLDRNFQYVSQFGVTGVVKNDNTGLSTPVSCCIDKDSNIYIADTINHRLVKLNKDLQYVSQFGTTNISGNSSSTLNQPRGCAVDSNGNIYVADANNHRLVKLNKDLQYVSQFGIGTSVSDNRGFNTPKSCCIDSNGNIFITDSNNHRIVKLNKNMEFVKDYSSTSDPLKYPANCCVDNYDCLIITDTNNMRIIRMSNDLTYLAQYNDGIMNYVNGCCVDSNNNIYFSDTPNHRLIKLKYSIFNISLNILTEKNTPSISTISISHTIENGKIIINGIEKKILNNVEFYKYNMDYLWDNIPSGNNALKIETERGLKELSFIKPEYEDSIYNNVECKPLPLTYSVAPSYDEAANPIPFNYTVSIDSTVLFTETQDISSIITNSISIPFATLVNKKYNLDAIRNIQIQKVETGKTISYNIPVKLRSQKIFSKYFNGVNNYISISKWTKHLNELTIQVIAKKDTEDTFSVITDNSLVSLSNDVLKIGGVSTFVGNIYEIRVWLKGKEQTYDSKYQIDENEDGLYALYRLNEYNSKTVFDSCINKLNGIFIGEFLKQEVVPTDSSNLFKFEIESKEEDVVTQKSNYDLKYRLSSISSNYKQIFGIDEKTEVVLPINNINIIENLIIRTNDSFETIVKVGEALLNPEKGWKRIDDSDSNIQYTNFTASTNATGNWNNTLHQCNQSDGLGADLIKFKFNGTRLRVLGLSHDYYPPKIEVKIDGTVVGEFSTRYAQLSMRLFYQITGLKRGDHIVELVCRSASSYTGYGYTIDAFDIDESGKMIALT